MNITEFNYFTCLLQFFLIFSIFLRLAYDSKSLYLSLSLSFSLSLFLSPHLSISLPFSLSIYLSLSHSFSLSLPFSLVFDHGVLMSMKRKLKEFLEYFIMMCKYIVHISYIYAFMFLIVFNSFFLYK